jgi:hypothetical protein
LVNPDSVTAVFSQCPCECNSPAGSKNKQYRGDNVSQFQRGKPPFKEGRVYTKNSGKQSKKCYDNRDAAEKCGGGLEVKRADYMAMGEGKDRGGHTAGGARQAIALFEAAGKGVKRDVITTHKPGEQENSGDGKKDKGGYNAPAGGCPLEQL